MTCCKLCDLELRPGDKHCPSCATPVADELWFAWGNCTCRSGRWCLVMNFIKGGQQDIRNDVQILAARVEKSRSDLCKTPVWVRIKN